MNEKESRQLKVGDRVIWDHDQSDAGTVTFAGARYVQTTWDNGDLATTDHRDMQRISKAGGEA